LRGYRCYRRRYAEGVPTGAFNCAQRESLGQFASVRKSIDNATLDEREAAGRPGFASNLSRNEAFGPDPRDHEHRSLTEIWSISSWSEVRVMA
jgi:hypothetical protein